MCETAYFNMVAAVKRNRLLLDRRSPSAHQPISPLAHQPISPLTSPLHSTEPETIPFIRRPATPQLSVQLSLRLFQRLSHFADIWLHRLIALASVMLCFRPCPRVRTSYTRISQRNSPNFPYRVARLLLTVLSTGSRGTTSF